MKNIRDRLILCKVRDEFVTFKREIKDRSEDWIIMSHPTFPVSVRSIIWRKMIISPRSGNARSELKEKQHLI